MTIESLSACLICNSLPALLEFDTLETLAIRPGVKDELTAEGDRCLLNRMKLIRVVQHARA